MPPRRRRRKKQEISDHLTGYFNPRLREGGDLFTLIFIFSQIYFNPRLREGGDNISIFIIKLLSNFNPRLREGGDEKWAWLESLSITISIHASVKEATNPRRMHDLYRLNFNPRLREGGDRIILDFYLSIEISIHASVKEATQSSDK